MFIGSVYSGFQGWGGERWGSSFNVYYLLSGIWDQMTSRGLFPLELFYDLLN